MSKKRWMILAIPAIAAAVLLGYKKVEEGGENPPPEPPPTECRTYVVGKLAENGWNRAAAEAVYCLNQEFVTQVYDLGSDALEQEFLAELQRLGKPEFQKTLETQPELAGLLASVLDVDANGARNIIQTIPPDEEGKTIVRNFYGCYAEPEKAARLAVLLKDAEMRDYLIRLWKHSPLGLTLLEQVDSLQELEDANVSAGKVYRRWLCNIFDELLKSEPGSPEEQNSMLCLDFFAERIRFLLQNGDDTFRDSFLLYWEQYQEILQEMLAGVDSTSQNPAEEKAWIQEYYSQDPRVFEFLHYYWDQNAVQLYRLYGPAASVMLMSQEFFDPQYEEARKKLVSLMIAENEDIRQNFTCALLQGLAEQPAFVSQFLELLQKKVSDHAFYCMAAQLAEANSRLSEKSPCQLVGYWMGLNDEVLESEFLETDPGLIQWVPGYDVARLVIRMNNGQKVTGWDVAFAGVDAAFIAVDAIGIALVPVTGGGSLVVTKGTSAAAKSGLKFASKAVVKKNSIVVGKNVAKGIARQTVKESAHECMGVLKSVYSKFSKDFVKELAKGDVEITKLVQFSFSRSRLGRKAYKKITGLDARVFMRKDRKVFFVLNKIPETPSGEIAKNLMVETVAGCSLGTALQTETGQEITSGAIETVQDSAEVSRKWQQNLSLWWLQNQKK